MPDREFARRMLQTVFTVAAVALLAAVAWQARSALMLIYVSAIAGVVHYFWRVKLDVQRPLIYAVVLALLLILRYRRSVRFAAR